MPTDARQAETGGELESSWLMRAQVSRRMQSGAVAAGQPAHDALLDFGMRIVLAPACSSCHAAGHCMHAPCQHAPLQCAARDPDA